MGEREQEAFDSTKWALLSALALGIPDVTKPFQLCVAENRGIAKGVLSQKLGPWKRPVAYLSKNLWWLGGPHVLKLLQQWPYWIEMLIN